MQCAYPSWLRKALSLLTVAALIGGCGSGDSAGNESYGEILHGLKKAAATHRRGYDAIGRAEGLKPALRASLDAFCEVNREMIMNEEAWKVVEGGYYLSRIKRRAERELPFVSTGPVNVAVKRYKGLFGLTSFEPKAVYRYDKACYPNNLKF